MIKHTQILEAEPKYWEIRWIMKSLGKYLTCQYHGLGANALRKGGSFTKPVTLREETIVKEIFAEEIFAEFIFAIYDFNRKSFFRKIFQN